MIERKQYILMMLAALASLSACDSSQSEEQGTITTNEAEALDEAARLLDERNARLNASIDEAEDDSDAFSDDLEPDASEEAADESMSDEMDVGIDAGIDAEINPEMNSAPNQAGQATENNGSDSEENIGENNEGEEPL